MENLCIVDFFIEEATRMYNALYIKTTQQYRDLYVQEENAYKKSSEYKKIKSKEYWNRPKEEIQREELEKEKAKLGYWVPHTAPSNTHITYQEKAVKDSTNSKNYATPTGFKASISPEDFFANQKNAILSTTKNPVIQLTVKEFAYKKIDWKKPDDFDFICIDYAKADKNAMFHFLEALEVIDSKIGFKRKLDFSNDKFYSYFLEPSQIVINNCIVKAKIVEQQKATEFKIDVFKHEAQLCILGKKVGDSFTLPNINLTYIIEEILA